MKDLIGEFIAAIGVIAIPFVVILIGAAFLTWQVS